MNPAENSRPFGAPGRGRHRSSSAEQVLGPADDTSCRDWFTLNSRKRYDREGMGALGLKVIK